jgi:AcrR family transcriptional regulator
VKRNQTNTSSSLRREREKEARRDEIVRASVEIFARDGFFGAKLDDIAEVSGFSRSGLYLYYPSGKGQLYADALGMAVTARDKRIHEALRDRAENSDVVTAVWRAFGDFYRETPEFVRLLGSLGFDDVRTAVSGKHLRPVVRQGTQTFEMLDDALRRVAIAGLPELHLAWILWSFFLGVVQFMESLAHLGLEDGAAGLLESALGVIRQSFTVGTGV